jgi:hypothetical protein
MGTHSIAFDARMSRLKLLENYLLASAKRMNWADVDPDEAKACCKGQILGELNRARALA